MPQMVIDAQVHAYERDHPGRPWHNVLTGPPEVTGEQMVAAMDDVGVDGALLVSPYTMYRFDASYATDVHSAHPDRFRMIKPLDPTDPAVAEVAAEWAATPGAVGFRLMMALGGATDPTDPGLNAILAAGARHGLPVNVLCWGFADVVDTLATNHPDTRIVVDHLGLSQPFDPPAPPDPWAQLPDVLALARHDNVAIKVTGACTLAHEPFPYPDLWDPLARVFDAYGLDRCLWGTDWTRAVNLLTYAQGVDSFRLTDRLSDDDRATLMGGAAASIYGWAP